MSTIVPRPPNAHDEDNSDDYSNTHNGRSRWAGMTIQHNPLHFEWFLLEQNPTVPAGVPRDATACGRRLIGSSEDLLNQTTWKRDKNHSDANTIASQSNTLRYTDCVANPEPASN